LLLLQKCHELAPDTRHRITRSDYSAETFHAYWNFDKPRVVQQSTTWTRVLTFTQAQSAFPKELKRVNEVYCSPRLASYGVIATAYL
jgi:hypothetical protein